MIIVEVNEKSKENELPFPKLMISKKGGLTILATDTQYNNIFGVVVGGNRYNVGHWSEIWDSKKFVDFHGSITLTQE